MTVQRNDAILDLELGLADGVIRRGAHQGDADVLSDRALGSLTSILFRP
ncbi:hypothetical protein GCM10007881_31080 [Mesorhizobium huakuii]|nr:hypothetical protein GCM10007881_31080 [Mesorhizobium huakuii]